MSEMRLNKFLARAGIASRRKADELIESGCVQVNGEVITELGTKVDPFGDHIRCHGKRVALPKGTPLVFAFHKPKHVMVTKKDPQGRPTVFDYLQRIPEPTRKHLVYVGRLDFDSEGLILFTTDGDLANQLTHPKNQIPRTYEVKVKGVPEEKAFIRLRKRRKIQGTWVKPTALKLKRATSSNAWLEMVLTEGKNRQIRELCFSVGHPVLKLKRISYANFKLGQLPMGSYRMLEQREVNKLRQSLEPKTKTKPKPRMRKSGNT